MSTIDRNRTRRVDVRLKTALQTGTLSRDLLIEGPAGTGKTYGILEVLHRLASENPGLRVLICRQTRASLTESVLATFEEDVLPADGSEVIARGERRDHRASYRYPHQSRIVLGGLDKPDRILSTAWDIIYVNEAIEVQENSWESLRGRLNRPGRDPRFGFLLGDTNPGDPSHWLNVRCNKGLTARWKTGHAANPALFDQSGWTRAWKPFRDNLSSLTGSRRERFFHGIWAAGEGAWFSQFDPTRAISLSAEFDPRWPVHLAVDTGVHVGAVWYQVREESDGVAVTVFGDYYSYDLPAYENAQAILAQTRALCGGRYDVGRYDPAGGARSGFGAQTIASEFERAGLRLVPWLKYPGCVLAGLNLLSSFVDVPGKLLIHPRCQPLVQAILNYRRAKRGKVFVDEPEAELHPYEDLVDPLRSSLLDRFPEGRRPEPRFMIRSARSVI